MSVWLIKCRKVIFFLILEYSDAIHCWRFWYAVSPRVMYFVYVLKNCLSLFAASVFDVFETYIGRDKITKICVQNVNYSFLTLFYCCKKVALSLLYWIWEDCDIITVIHVCCMLSETAVGRAFIWQEQQSSSENLIWKHISPLWCSSYSLVRKQSHYQHLNYVKHCIYIKQWVRIGAFPLWPISAVRRSARRTTVCLKWCCRPTRWAGRRGTAGRPARTPPAAIP